MLPLKNLLKFFILSNFIFPFTTAFAETIGFSTLKITNNTNTALQVEPSLNTNDSSFIQGKDWDKQSIKLEPYETRDVLWFSRNIHVKNNLNYLFTVKLISAENSDTNVMIALNEAGKSVFGSTLKAKMTLPNQSAIDIFQKESLEKFAFEANHHSYSIYTNAYLKAPNVFDDFQIVINQSNSNDMSTPNPTEISVLTYNTQLLPFYANVVDDLNQPSVRVRDIPTQITGYDVVILEELFDRDLRNNMILAMSKHYPFHTRIVGDNTSKTLTGGTMIFSKWPITFENQFVYSAGTGADSYAAKGAVYASINKDGKQYHIIGTHLQASSNPDAVRVRVKQLQELANFIDRLNISREDPLIIGGDFNIDEFGNELSNLLATLQVNMVKNIGYQYSFDGMRNTMTVDHARVRLDYIFYRNNYQIPTNEFNKIFVLRDLDNRKMWSKFDLSDHFPVWAYFKFN